MVLDDLSFTIEQNQVACLSGVSGTGKSTIVKLLLKNIDPQQGIVRIHGVDIGKRTKRDIRNAVKFVPQNTTMLFNNSIYYNIIYGIADSDKLRRSVMEIIKNYGLLDVYRNVSPQTEFEFLDFVVGRNGERLSGGQRQLVHILRCVVNMTFGEQAQFEATGAPKGTPKGTPKGHRIRSRLILLDEPTTALDSKTKHSLLRLLWDLYRSDCTVLIISHDPEVNDFCHSSYVVDKTDSGSRVVMKKNRTDRDGGDI